MTLIPYGRQSIAEDDIEAVVEVLRSDWITQGPAIESFERAVADYCGVRHAVAVSSGTAALHLACLALGLGPGDVLWTAPNTFVASANCALYCGADVDFVDIEPGTWNMDVAQLRAKLEESVGERKRLPKVVVPVHFGGVSCDMAGIHELAQEYGFMVLEDACHALGSRYRGMPVGSCGFSEAAVFSFHPVKSITTGEGGMVVTNDEALTQRLRLLRSHGITRESTQMAQAPEGPWSYEQVALGFNYRITDLQAGLGRSQLRNLDEFVGRRNELARAYAEGLESLPLSPQEVPSDTTSAYHLYVVTLEADSKRGRGEVFSRLRTAGVGVNVHYIPVHTQPHYRKLGFRNGDFPVAEDYYSRTITLPLYPALQSREQGMVLAAAATAVADD